MSHCRSATCPTTNSIILDFYIHLKAVKHLVKVFQLFKFNYDPEKRKVFEI